MCLLRGTLTASLYIIQIIPVFKWSVAALLSLFIRFGCLSHVARLKVATTYNFTAIRRTTATKTPYIFLKSVKRNVTSPYNIV
jgi:hypothetical protein